ncbi:hypothetical protein SAMN02745121_04658 [Nannocystis exedens]|uniref:Uncharacterized protein n=1 Tax=Nannocystis exedens TaxID=54 RepID=A0A1I2BGJ9_9BACT|nr:hypothetical protein [Nannocystis exedens]PCC67999.1 ribulose-phosphate 3-epimerase [Nannocystis exedens]SFE54968.1 hypothetical protein SAMN02745121_04658 [Nannocystis exedens]
MKLCDACHRHVRPTEGACPFCGRSLRTTAAARLGAVVLLGALETACSSRPVGELTDSDTATPGTSTSGDGTSGALTSTTSTSTTSTTSTSTTSTSGVVTTEASSTGELSSTGDIDTSDTGCSFYGGCPADFANPFECSTFDQDCPAGEKCSAKDSGGFGFDVTECVPVARDPDQPGEPCTVEGGVGSGIDSCDVGSKCWHVDEQTLAGTCVPMCGGTLDAPECAASTACVPFGDALHLCLPTCDPLAPACAAGDVCVSNPGDAGGPFVCVHDASGDGGGEFEPCEFLNGCDLGLACLPPDSATECDPEAVGCCLTYCDLTAPMCSGAGAECVSWFEQGQAPTGLEDLGVCVLPL